MQVQARVVVHVVGVLTAFAGVSMLVPAGISLVYGEAAAVQFLLSGALTMATGFLAYRLTRPIADRLAELTAIYGRSTGRKPWYWPVRPAAAADERATAIRAQQEAGHVVS